MRSTIVSTRATRGVLRCLCTSSAPPPHIQWQRYTPKKINPGAVPLLLVHGFACGGEDWGKLPKVLGIRSKREVISFDNRGIGRSDSPPGPYTIADMVADTHQVMEAASVERASVMGISLGGMIAQSFALEHPERTNALILGCTTHGGREATPLKEECVRLFQGWASEDDPNSSPVAIDFLKAMLPPEALVGSRGEALFKQIKSSFLRTRRTSAGLRGQLGAMGRFNTTAQLGGLASCPTLVISGDHDEIVHPANSASLARRIPGSSHVVWEGAGHFWWATRTAEVVGTLAHYLETCDS